MTIEWPKVYFGKSGWTFTAVIDGRLVERNISEYHAMGLAESILAASKRKADLIRMSWASRLRGARRDI